MKAEVVLLLLFIAIPLFAQNETVKIDLDVPENVIAGNDFKVVLTINKEDLRDYSRFSQELPPGFTAANLSSPNADFTFTDQRVRIIWLKLPSEPVLNIVYMISVHERLSGKLELGGTFAFVNDGVRAFIDLPDLKTIEIKPNPNIDPELVVDVSEFQDVIGKEGQGTEEALTDVAPQEADEAYFARVIRQKPDVASDGIVTVNLLVNKPEDTDFLKVEEYIPSGYTFESLVDNNAVVTQSSSIARYVWMSVPDEDMFMLQYRLIPIPEEAQGELIIEGNMTYTEDGNSKVESVRELEEDLLSLDDAQLESILYTGTFDGTVLANNQDEQADEIAEQEEQSEQEEEIVDQEDQEEEIAEQSEQEEEIVEQEEQAEQTEEIVNQQEQTTPESIIQEGDPAAQTPSADENKSYNGVYVKTKLKKIIKIEPLEESEGIYFRVQIGAIKKPYFARVVYAEYDILRDVKAEYIDAWHKFTLGSFLTFNEASAFKNRVLSETPTESAFIVAYKDGNRVPISEVL